MPPLPKPILGEITAFTIATPDLEQSLAYYRKLGYSEVMRADWPFPWIQVSDGAVLIMLRKDQEPYIALTYYVKNIAKVVKDVEQKGIQFAQKAQAKDVIQRYLLQSPDGLNISLVGITEGFKQPAGPGMLAMQPRDHANPEKYVNKTCGMYGEFAHPVSDLDVSIAYWELLGFKVISKFTSPYPWAIISDGLSIVGLHQSSHFSYPAITYFAADMHEKIQKLIASGLTGYAENSSGGVILTTPEQQHIFLFPMGMSPQKKTKSLPDLKQTVLETKHLWLKELNPEIMDILFTSFPDEDIMLLMGITEDELGQEREQFNKGLTTYRLSFKNFLMVEKASNKVVGRCGYHTWYLQHSRAELGYAMTDEAAKRKGLMSEAVSAVVDYGFEEMKLNRIEALVGTENEASLKIVKRLGFTEEGLLRSHYFKNGVMEDSIMFALLRDEWES